MQITETASEGLKRSYKVVVTSDAIEENIKKKLAAIGDQARLPGFRPGKIPAKVLRARFGKSIRGEVLQETVDETLRKTLDDNNIRPALQPKIEVSTFDEGKDLEYTMELEVLPEIVPVDFSKIELERLVAEIEDSEVEEAIESIAKQQKTFNTEEGAVANEGDAVLIDFEGSIDGELFEGGAGKDSQIQLGSGQFVPGFEEQLIGAKGGEDREVSVTFPADYPYDKLREKNAVFKVTVKEVRKPSVPPVNDELATRLGLEGLGQLKERVREQLVEEYGRVSRQRLKRDLLDKLDEAHDFELPPSLVDNEFDGIWQQIERDREAGSLDPDDSDKSDEVLKEDYRKIASRRVRLGLLLSSVGEANKVTVGQDELNRAMSVQAQRFPGQEQEIFKYYKENPEAAMQLQAPLFEDKVVDFVLELVDISERAVPKDELLADPDSGYNVAEKAKKPTKKAKAQSGSTKKKSDGDGAADKPATKPKVKKAAKKED
ncbi:MAG: trigger factor [Alphaproteobacteria bacterium]|nr:trigger factor [Alphaproteobacteria bacterium]